MPVGKKNTDLLIIWPNSKVKILHILESALILAIHTFLSQMDYDVATADMAS